VSDTERGRVSVTTMRQVAERAGVSAKSVSRVMNDDRYVSDDVRQRVQASVAELGYVPNSLARTFRSGRNAVLGVAVPDVSDPFFAAVTHAIEQTARARGVAVLVTSLGTDGGREREGVEALLGRQLTGLICAPVADDQSYLTPWQARTGLVFIDRPPRRIVRADCVVQDDAGGAFAATTHLAEHGHRRIAFLGDHLSVATTAQRLHGYRRALAASGAVQDDALVRTGITTDAEATEAVTALLQQPAPPTAIFSSDATCSVGLVPALHRSGRSDLAVIGFSDFPLAASLQPALTVIDQDPQALGRFAATRLFHRLDRPGQRLPRRTVLPVALVTRNSCGHAGTNWQRTPLA
jgi:LacI family transcriptional regulator